MVSQRHLAETALAPAAAGCRTWGRTRRGGFRLRCRGCSLAGASSSGSLPAGLPVSSREGKAGSPVRFAPERAGRLGVTHVAACASDPPAVRRTSHPDRYPLTPASRIRAETPAVLQWERRFFADGFASFLSAGRTDRSENGGRNCRVRGTLLDPAGRPKHMSRPAGPPGPAAQQEHTTQISERDTAAAWGRAEWA